MKQLLQNTEWTKVLGTVRAAGFDLNSEIGIVNNLLSDSYFNDLKYAGRLIRSHGGNHIKFFDYLKNDVDWLE